MAQLIQNNADEFVTENGKSKRYITHNRDRASWICSIEKITRGIFKSEQELFPQAKNNRGNSIFLKTKLGISIILLLKYVEIIRLTIFDHCLSFINFNPYVVLFVDEVEKSGIDKVYLQITPQAEQWNALNKLVESLRIQIKSQEFQKLIKNFERSANKNCLELTSYIGTLFKKNSTLHAIKIDLLYKNFDQTGVREVHTLVSCEEAKNHWKKMLRYLRKTYSKNFVGFVWKLEFDLLKSWSFRVIVFLKDLKGKKEIDIARCIGNEWVNHVTDKKRLYFDGSPMKFHWATHFSNPDQKSNSLREELGSIAQYLTKQDCLFRVSKKNCGKSFGKGVLPKATVKRNKEENLNS